ncbi:DUF4865 family protein [Nocardioides sp. 503]|uniref:DUF4865 family protein n=1 Tax=Nocardioides sp. 503 TaxID=2508326 RepID=UPI00106FE8FA|nr:DUF4865 family protein [Nocardioides sp. 503]
MHYDIRLPRDYDMHLVRERVATRGHLLDELPGLGIKAYLARDVTAGAPCNSYSPLYLWHDTGAASTFLWGRGGFAGIVRDFGRPPVRTWLGGSFRRSGDPSAPRHATVSTAPLAVGTSLEDTAARSEAWCETTTARPGVHSAASLIDTSTWTLTQLVLTTTRVPAQDLHGGAAEEFEVLHLSAPGIGALR